MRIRERIAPLRKSAFLRAVGLLAGGATFAHGITALALPIVTRLYSPQDFSVLAVFTGALATIAVAACLRFDVAIPLPKDDAEAINVLALALVSAVIVAALLSVVLTAAPSFVTSLVNQPGLGPFLWLIPVGVLLAGAFSALQNWFVRRKEFSTIAATRIAQATAGSGAQIGLGLVAVGAGGLVVGQALSSGAGCVGLFFRLVKGDRALLARISLRGMKSAWAAYDRFPKFSALEALCNSAGMQVPIIMIAALAAGPEAGFVALAMFVMQAPMGLIGSAISQVFLSRAPEEYRNGRLGELTASVLNGLLRSGIGPLIFAGIVAPVILPALLGGEQWRRAGELVAWMMPWFIMQFLTAPISMSLHVMNHQRTALLLQIFGFFLRVVAVYVGWLIADTYMSEAYALSGLFFYSLYLFAIVRLTGVPTSAIKQGMRACRRPVVLWIGSGLGLVLGINVVGFVFARFL